MSAKSRAALTAEQLVLFPDNSTKFITPAKLREALENVNDSMYNPTTDGAISGTIESKTYAQWEVIRAASGLTSYLNKYIFVSDKSVYLIPIAVDKFALKGIWKNTVSSVDYYNECSYTFGSIAGANEGLLKISDSLGNSINNNTANLFSFNSPLIIDNICDSGFIKTTSALGQCKQNYVTSNARLRANNSTITGIVNRNKVFAGDIDCSGIAGTFDRNLISTGNGITAALNSGIEVSDCTFMQEQQLTLDPNVSYSGKTIRNGYSDFDKTISITSVTTLTNSATYGAHIGIMNLTSANATETINLFANAPTTHPFRIYPASGLTVTFTHATGANQPICAGGISAVLNGANGDWVEFTYNSTTSRFYQTDGETY